MILKVIVEYSLHFEFDRCWICTLSAYQNEERKQFENYELTDTIGKLYKDNRTVEWQNKTRTICQGEFWTNKETDSNDYSSELNQMRNLTK
jgi:hypothetical protein